MSSSFRVAGALALSLHVMAAVRAEDAPPPVLMDEQVVRLPRAEASGDPTAAATVIEASRFAGEAKGVAALVATAPGVAVNDYGGLGQLTTVSIRGSTAAGVLVLLDGLPLNTAFGGGVDLSSIPRGWVDRIEVLRGPEGALYGTGALGGVVNVVTRAAVAGSWNAEVTGGSFGTGSLALDGAVPALGGALLLAASGDTTRGDFPFLLDAFPSTTTDPLIPQVRGNNAAWRAGALAKLAAPTSAGRVDALLQLSAGERGLPGFARNPTPDDWQHDGRLLASVRLARGAGGGGADGGDGPGELSLFGRLSGRLDWLDVRVGGPAPVSQRGAAVELTGGLDWRHGPGLLTAQLTAATEGLQSDGLPSDQLRNSAAIAVADDLLLAAGRLRVAPALRFDVVDRFHGLSGKLGATWRLDGLFSLRASAGRTFRVPSLAELSWQQGLLMPNPELVPESGQALDAALVVDGRLGFASLGGQVTRYHQLIIYQPSALGRLKPFNAGEALVSGLELEAATAPLLGAARASLSGAFTWLHSELLKGSPDEVGNQIPFRPSRRLYARAAVAPEPFEAHLEAHYVGLRYQDTRNDLPIPASLAWNAGASLLLVRRLALSLHLEVKNLLDDRTLNDGFGNPLPSRMVLVTVRAGASPTQGTP